ATLGHPPQLLFDRLQAFPWTIPFPHLQTQRVQAREPAHRPRQVHVIEQRLPAVCLQLHQQPCLPRPLAHSLYQRRHPYLLPPPTSSPPLPPGGSRPPPHHPSPPPPRQAPPVRPLAPCQVASPSSPPPTPRHPPPPRLLQPVPPPPAPPPPSPRLCQPRRPG